MKLDDEQKTIVEFLTAYYIEKRTVGSPRSFAMSVVRQLQNATRCDQAIRQIARACHEAAAWDKPWPGQVGEVLDLLECYGYRENKPSVSEDVSQAGDEMTEAEENLWAKYIKGWVPAKTTTDREAPHWLDILNESQRVGKLTLREFLDSFARKYRSPYEK